MKKWIMALSLLFVTASLVADVTVKDHLRSREKWNKLNAKQPHATGFDLYQNQATAATIQVLYSRGIGGDWIQLADGSEWKISPENSYLVAQWRAGDQIFITQSDCGSCSFHYRLVNATRDVVVYANRLSKPLSYLTTAKTITAIDPHQERIFLSDGTYWEVTWVDDITIKSWHLGDLVMIGVNGGYNRGSYPILLINVSSDPYDLSLDQWVTAKQID